MNTAIAPAIKPESSTRLLTPVVQLGKDARQLSIARIHIIHAYKCMFEPSPMRIG